MGEEFYAIIKLVSGEEIFSLVSIDNTNENSVVILQNPVILKYISREGGIAVKLEPWIKFSDDDFFVINIEKIITMTESKEENIIHFYNEYLDEYSSKRGKNELKRQSISSDSVKVTDKMGYIGSVDAARKKLEDIFNNIKDN